MLKGLFTKKMLALFASMAIIGFFIGYDYALIISRNSGKDVINISKRTENVNYENEPDAGLVNDAKSSLKKGDRGQEAEPEY